MIFSLLEFFICFHLNIVKLLQLEVLNLLLISKSLKETHLFLESIVFLLFEFFYLVLDFVFLSRLKLLNDLPGNLSFLLNGLNLPLNDALNGLSFLLKVLLVPLIHFLILNDPPEPFILLLILNSLRLQLQEFNHISILVPPQIILFLNLLKYSFLIVQMLPPLLTYLNLPLHIGNLVSNSKPLLPQMIEFRFGLLTPLGNLLSVPPEHLQLKVIRVTLRPLV